MDRGASIASDTIDAGPIEYGVYDPASLVRGSARFDVDHIFVPWPAHDLALIEARIDEANTNGRSMMIIVEPFTHAPDWRSGGDTLFRHIRAGQFDREVNRICAKAREINGRKYIRWGMRWRMWMTAIRGPGQVHEKALGDLERDVRERERDKQQAEAHTAAWERDWAQALSCTWFADKAGSIAAVRAILTALGTLPAILRERQDLSSRVAAMERDQAQFRMDIAELLAECGENPPSGDALAAANALAQRHEAARRAVQLRTDKQADLERQLEKRRALEEDLAVHHARKNELASYFGADSLAAVEIFMNQARERDQLEGRIAVLRRQIMEALRAASFDEAETRLSGIDADQVERDAMELGTRIHDLTEQSKQLYADKSLAQQKLDAVGSDDAVARIEARRRTIFLEIEELAVRHLTLRTGALGAEQALHLYRDRHRCAMMNRASQAFRLITGGNYSGLTTQPDRDKEILIGLALNSGSKLTDAMSTGTQFQLYLALRLAGHEEFATLRPPVPFVADDIMESFDNPRSEEVFRLLGEMAKVGQVIYLTHHWHLCEIARRVVPDVTVHEL
jgi:uncharacterized protein YhaN